jgi:ATP-dependent DNA ligase
VPAANGTAEFSLLQNELKGTSTKIILVAFDLLYLNGCDLRKLPLIERKAQLKKIIDETDVQFGDRSRSKAPRCTRESFESLRVRKLHDAATGPADRSKLGAVGP